MCDYRGVCVSLSLSLSLSGLSLFVSLSFLYFSPGCVKGGTRHPSRSLHTQKRRKRRRKKKEKKGRATFASLFFEAAAAAFAFLFFFLCFFFRIKNKKKKPILSISARVYPPSPLLVRATRRVYHDTLYSPRDVCFYVKSNDDDSRFLFFSSHLEKREED